ncbi:MAG: hypothetical protein M1812_005578 [Candelaria pacifica]|nr:MAG: hypothetical protein M1812_005578 [Candelaria pacifica]
MPVIDLSQVPDTQERKAFLLSQYGTGLQRYRLTHKIPETPPDSPLFEHIVTVPDDNGKRKGKDGSVDPIQPAQTQSAATVPHDLSTIISSLEDNEGDAAIRRIQISALQVGNKNEWTGTLLPEASTDPAEDTPETPPSHEPQLGFEEVNILLAELRAKGLEQLAALGQQPQTPRKLAPQRTMTLPAGRFSENTGLGLMSFATADPSVRLRPTGSTGLGSIPLVSSTPSNVEFVDVTLILSKPTLAPVLEEYSRPVPAVPTAPSGLPAVGGPEVTPEVSIKPSRVPSIGLLRAELVDLSNIFSSSPTPTRDVERIWPTFDLESEAFRTKKPHPADEPTTLFRESGHIDDGSTRKTESVFGAQNAAIALLFAYIFLTLYLRVSRYNGRRQSAASGKGPGHRIREGGDKLA